jgi:hypothetical protein
MELWSTTEKKNTRWSSSSRWKNFNADVTEVVNKRSWYTYFW